MDRQFRFFFEKWSVKMKNVLSLLSCWQTSDDSAWCTRTHLNQKHNGNRGIIAIKSRSESESLIQLFELRRKLNKFVRYLKWKFKGKLSINFLSVSIVAFFESSIVCYMLKLVIARKKLKHFAIDAEICMSLSDFNHQKKAWNW